MTEYLNHGWLRARSGIRSMTAPCRCLLPGQQGSTVGPAREGSRIWGRGSGCTQVTDTLITARQDRRCSQPDDSSRSADVVYSCPFTEGCRCRNAEPAVELVGGRFVRRPSALANLIAATETCSTNWHRLANPVTMSERRRLLRRSG